MIIGFGNNVVSSLAADITAIQTTIQVMPGAGAMFANLLTSDYANSSNPLKTYAKITLTDAKETVFEVCHLTAVNNDMLTVIRGQEGTTAKGWSLNDVIANFATRGSENQFVQIEELQSGHYVAGVAGGTENNLTLELPATYFVNGGADWTLRTPLVVIPALNNTGASTLQLTMGGRVLGIFPLYKGNKSELSASDIIKDVPVLCVLDNTKTYFSVLNPLEIYLGSRYLQKDQNLSDVPDKALARQSLQLGNSATLNVGTTANTVAAGNDSRITGAMQKDQNGADIPDKPGFIKNVGLGETVDQAAGAMQKSQNGADIPDAALFRRNIGVYDASTSQKGLVRLSGGVSDADDTLAATPGAVKIAYDAAQSAWRLAASKYTAEGATTGKAGLVQLVNSMGWSGSLVMPQAAVTTAIQSYPSLGKGQTLQDLRGSRSIDATYTNSTGFPIAVYVRVSGGYSANLYAHVNGIEFGGGGSTASNSSIATTFFIVPNGATYRVMASGASIALQAWSELR
ncbi:phage tail protein [Salmonella enterica subsp. diarizonae]|nr:phage tail protein [Salmonella enterica subsp. diarizonae]EFO7851792.1 phage tail protein [Salmonella enterica]ECJ2633433.1 phage tail protein [Salmonella enterica subsp. diarizonae]EDQ0638695.1 phage tail protein [Salmonella enterica subsp. diarizonae]EGD5374491.1 phage tail protein [Salmonella enterica]